MSDPTQPHGLQPTKLLCLWNSPGKNTGVCYHSLPGGSSQPRDWTWVSWIAGRLFTVWVTMEACYQLSSPRNPRIHSKVTCNVVSQYHTSVFQSSGNEIRMSRAWNERREIWIVLEKRGWLAGREHELWLIQAFLFTEAHFIVEMTERESWTWWCQLWPWLGL